MHHDTSVSTVRPARLAALVALTGLGLALGFGIAAAGCAESPSDGKEAAGSGTGDGASAANAGVDDMGLRILGRQVYDEACLACHQADGQGVPWMQPPLAGAEGVLVDDTERMIEMLLRGVGGDPATGSMAGNGDWSQAMPTFAGRTDEELAAVLTYIRHAWDNGAAPVAPSAVTAMRARVDAAMAEGAGDADASDAGDDSAANPG